MKELTTEQKAQRYDDAINAIKELKEKHPTALVIKDWIKENFPELKESEDEKIRKELIAFLRSYDTFLTQKFIVWLEKQGEQKSQGKSALEAINEEKVDNANKVKTKFNKVKTKFQRIIAEQEFGLHSYSPRIRNILIPNGVDPDKIIADMTAEQFYKLLLIFNHNENIK